MEPTVYKSETLRGSLDDLAAFCAVVELGSLSAAARHLTETKGSISRRITRLEQRLNATLLARNPRAVNATEEGLAFYAKARDALQLLNDAAQTARHARSEASGLVRITTPRDLGLDWLPAHIVRFRQHYPRIQIEILLDDATLDLAANRIDLALRATSGELPDMNYKASRVMDFDLGVYASPNYLETREQPCAPNDLATWDWIVARSSAGGVKLTFDSNKGQRCEMVCQPVIRCNDYAGAHRILLAGGGVGVLPSLIAQRSVADGRLIRLLPDWSLGRAALFAISVAGAQAPARVRLLRDFLRAETAAN